MVEAGAPRLLQHAGGEIDPAEAMAERAQAPAHQARAAAEVEDIRREAIVADRGQDRREKRVRHGIGEAALQRGVEIISVAVEEPGDKGRRRRIRHGRRAEAGEPQAGTEAVEGIGGEHGSENRHRLLGPPGRLQKGAEPDPAERPAGGQRERLAHQVGRRGRVALPRQALGIGRPPVGAGIAGSVAVAVHG